MKKQLIKGLVLLAISTPALAVPGYYVQGELGQVALSSGTHDMFNPFTNPAGTAGRIAFGHLWGDANLNYGLETGASYFPNVTYNASPFPGLVDDNIKYEGYSFDLLGVVKYTFNTGFTLFAKGGAAYLHQKATEKLSIASYPAGEKTITDSKFAPEAAVGFGYQFTPKVELNLTASTIFAGEPDFSQNHVLATTNSVLIGLTYNLD